MGLYQKIKDTYKKIDKRLGGYLPGGNKEEATEEAPQESTRVTTQEPNRSAVNVTDYSNGKSTKTTTSRGRSVVETRDINNQVITRKEDGGSIDTPQIVPKGNNIQAGKAEFYYDIENPNRQYSRAEGAYGGDFNIIPNPVTNPQNVLPNTNRGTGWAPSGRQESIELYYDIEDPSKQFARPTGNYGSNLTPVKNPSFSFTTYDREKGTAVTNVQTYALDPKSIAPNINEATSNPRYKFSQIDWGGTIGYFPTVLMYGGGVSKYGSKETRITADIYINQLGNDFLTGVNKVGQPLIDAAFFNPQTRRVNTSSKAYKFLNYKTTFNTFDFLKTSAFIPFMQTGTQTYLSTFGTEPIKTGSRQMYISPIDKLNLQDDFANLANPSKTKYGYLGKEIVKTEDSTVVQEYFKRDSGSLSQRTIAKTTLWKTGEDRLAGFTKGTTYIKGSTLSGQTFIITRNFAFQGVVTNIAETQFTTKSRLFIQTGNKPVYRGDVNGIYYPDGSASRAVYVKDYVSLSSEGNRYTGVVAIREVANIPKEPYFQVSSNALDLKFYQSLGGGRLYRLGTTSIGNQIISSGSASTRSLTTTASVQTFSLASNVERFSIASVKGSVPIVTTATTASVPLLTTTRAVNAMAPLQNQYTIQRQERVFQISMPTISDMGMKSETISAMSGGSRQAQATQQRQITIQIPTTIPQIPSPLKNINRMVPGFANNYYFNAPVTTRFPGAAAFDLNPSDLFLTSNIVRGGQRVTRYSPSYSAIFFNIRGRAKGGAETGINFRPITPGYSFNTGLQGGFFKKLKRFFK